MSVPISPKAVVGSGERELPAYVSNGLIGLRVREVPLTSGHGAAERLHRRTSGAAHRSGGDRALPDRRGHRLGRSLAVRRSAPGRRSGAGLRFFLRRTDHAVHVQRLRARGAGSRSPPSAAAPIPPWSARKSPSRWMAPARSICAPSSMRPAWTAAPCATRAKRRASPNRRSTGRCCGNQPAACRPAASPWSPSC